jgi:hypothetical protein
MGLPPTRDSLQQLQPFSAVTVSGNNARFFLSSVPLLLIFSNRESTLRLIVL